MSFPFQYIRNALTRFTMYFYLLPGSVEVHGNNKGRTQDHDQENL